MNRTIINKTILMSILWVAVISFIICLPKTSFGEDVCPLRVDVSPYQVNIDAGGEAHYVRVLTYTSYSNTKEVFVYIDYNEDAVDPGYIELTRDSLGHLVVKIDLIALQDAGLQAWAVHTIRIAVVLETRIDECAEKEGVGEIYITGKKGS